MFLIILQYSYFSFSKSTEWVKVSAYLVVAKSGNGNASCLSYMFGIPFQSAAVTVEFSPALYITISSRQSLSSPPHDSLKHGNNGTNVSFITHLNQSPETNTNTKSIQDKLKRSRELLEMQKLKLNQLFPFIDFIFSFAPILEF